MGAKTAQEQLAELEREFERPDSTMRADHFHARHDELVQAAKNERELKKAEAPAAPAPDVVTRTVLAGALEEVGRVLKVELRKRDERIAALEAKPAIAISASGDLKVDGARHFEHIAASVKALQQTLRATVRPIYDEQGRLIGAKRDE